MLPLSRTQLRAVTRLKHRRGRDDAGQFLVEGPQAVREALAAGVVETLIVADVDAHRDLVSAIDSQRVRVGSDADIRQLSETVSSQGIFAVARIVEHHLEQLHDARLLVICAQVRDPGNAGTVIRCADAFGADGVILTQDSVELHNPKTVRASVGSVFHLPIVTDVTVETAVGFARDAGMQVLAAAGGGESLDELGEQLSGPTAWIMGNEAWGLPAKQLALADQTVGVPMWGRAESLNLSTAAAVCLYQTAVAQRTAAATIVRPAR